MRNSLAALVLGCLLSAEALACSCVPMTVRDYAKGADSIYLATLQEARMVEGSSEDWPQIEGKFEVYKTLKGSAPKGLLTLSTPADSPACGVTMLVSARYIIFKRKGRDHIITCDGSGILGHTIIGQDEDEITAEILDAMKGTPPKRK